MIRLAYLLAPYAMAVFGAVLIVVGIGTLFSKVETEPTTVAIASLSASAPQAQWLKVTGCEPRWDDLLTVVTTSKRSGRERGKEHYLPFAGGPNPNNPLVLVKYEQDELPGEGAAIAEVTGTRKPFSSADKLVRDEIEKAGLAANVIVIDANDKPLQKREAGVMSLVGVGLAGVGSFWSFRRWSPSTPSTPAGGFTMPPPGAVPPGGFPPPPPPPRR